MSNLRKKLIKLAHDHPEFRKDLLPLVQKQAAVSPADKKVVDAFLDKKPADSKKLSTDGKRLDGLWMGGTGIAEWKGGKIDMPDLGSKAADSVQKIIQKKAPANWLKKSGDLSKLPPALREQAEKKKEEGKKKDKEAANHTFNDWVHFLHEMKQLRDKYWLTMKRAVADHKGISTMEDVLDAQKALKGEAGSLQKICDEFNKITRLM